MGAGGNTGIGIIDQGLHDPFGAVVNVLTNFATFGTAGYSRDEGFTKQQGINFHMYDEAIGEIDGRNRARDSTAEAMAKVRDQAAADEVNAANELKSKQQADINASRAAAGAGRTSASARPIDPSASTNTSNAALGTQSDDFLGL